MQLSMKVSTKQDDYSWGIQAKKLPKYPVLLVFKQQILHFIWSCLTLDPNTLLKFCNS